MRNLRAAAVARRGAAVAAVVVLVSGCAGGTDWQPRKPTESIDLSSFDARYTPVIASLTSATAGTGFTWDHAAPSNTVIAKFGICSWRLRQSGTWAGNKGQLRDLRNILNRTLVQNGFHAAAWKNESSAPLFISQDRYAALLEVTLGHPATIDIYSPAAGTTCP